MSRFLQSGLALLLGACLLPPRPAPAEGFEDFANFPETGNSSYSGTFTGRDGSTWTYVQCRGDKTIADPSISLNKGKNPLSSIESGTLTDGCGTLSFDFMLLFNPTVQVDVVISGTIRHTVTGGLKDTVYNTGPIAINQGGNFTLKFVQHDNNASQVAIDNVSWTSYGGADPEPPALIFSPDTNRFLTEHSAPVTLNVTATEPNVDTVRLWATGLPPGASFPGATGAAPLLVSFSWTPTESQTGSHSVVFYAADKDGTNSRPFSIEVTPIYPYYHYAMGLTGPALKAQLHDIISTDTHQLEDEGSDNELDQCMKAIHADPAHPNNVLLLYNPTSSVPKTMYDESDGWNKEHCWPQSKSLSGSGPDVVDAHNLYAEDKYVNILRANLIFDESNPNDPAYRNPATNTAPLASMDSDSWEPPPASKGNVARALFYMSTRYDGSDGRLPLVLTNTPTAINHMGVLSALLLWHAMDPPDDWERTRNELIFTDYQYNRNPFIDHPEWVEAIWGTDSDGDGITDTHEIIAGTSPANSNSVFEATPSATQITCGALSSGSVWRLYEGSFQGTDIAWRLVAQTNRLANGTLNFPIAPTSPATFYHLRALLTSPGVSP